MHKPSKISQMTRKKICELTDLPHPSVLLMRVMPLFWEKEVNMRRLVEEIGGDQVFVAKMLRLVNSSYYNLRRRVDSVESAVTMLGLVNIKQILFSAACFDYYSDQEQGEWSHAYTSSLLVSELMKNNYVPAKNNLQLTALLHDIGKVVFRRKSRKNYEAVLAEAKAQNVPVSAMEKEAFGCDHAEVGAWLMEAWQMPNDIIRPIAEHHLVHTADEHMIETSILKLANWVDNSARLGAFAPPPPPEFNKLASILDMDIQILLRFQQDLIRTVSSEDQKLAVACV